MREDCRRATIHAVLRPICPAGAEKSNPIQLADLQDRHAIAILRLARTAHANSFRCEWFQGSGRAGAGHAAFFTCS